MSWKEKWDRAIEEKVNAGLDRMRAVAAVVHEDPQLHQRMLAEANAGRPVHVTRN